MCLRLAGPDLCPLSIVINCNFKCISFLSSESAEQIIKIERDLWELPGFIAVDQKCGWPEDP